MADQEPYFLMVGIDFGTTFSGYAFQLTSSYKVADPTAGIFCPQAWNNNQTRLASLKTPTCLLLDRNTDIVSFGYEAEDRYADLCMDGDHRQYYYFRRFKMELHDNKVTIVCMSFVECLMLLRKYRLMSACAVRAG